MKWSIAEGYRLDNPVDVIGAALPKAGGASGHFKALHHSEVGGAIEKVRLSGAFPSTPLAFEFSVLTATRSSETRLARWHEINFENALWVLPPARTKMNRPHRIPLSSRALEILNESKDLFGGDDDALVFPSAKGVALSDSTISKLVRELGIEGTPHGIARASFRSWCADSGVSREVAEAALGHLAGEVEQAYQRSDLLERRREIMEGWARYLAGAAPAKVIELRPRTG